MAKVTQMKRRKKDEESGQQSLIDEGIEPRTEKMFEIDLAISIKEDGGKPDKVTLLNTMIKGTLVEDAIQLALKDPRNKAVIKVMLWNPTPEQIEEAERLREKAQADGEQALQDDC